MILYWHFWTILYIMSEAIIINKLGLDWTIYRDIELSYILYYDTFRNDI